MGRVCDKPFKDIDIFEVDQNKKPLPVSGFPLPRITSRYVEGSKSGGLTPHYPNIQLSINLTHYIWRVNKKMKKSSKNYNHDVFST